MAKLAELEHRTIFQVPATNLPALQTGIAAISTKAGKLALPDIVPLVIGFHRSSADERIYQIILTCDPPERSGWTVLARLDHDATSGVLLRSVPNLPVPVPDSYRAADPQCDHCGQHRHRRDTYILYHSARRDFRQIGHSCLGPFLGHDARTLLLQVEWQCAAREIGHMSEIHGRQSGPDRRHISLPIFLSQVACMIRLHGWVSKTAAVDGQEATAARAMRNMQPEPFQRAVERVEDEDRLLARNAVEWVLRLAEKTDASDYDRNLGVLASEAFFMERSAALAATIVGGFVQMLERKEARRAVAS